VIAHFGEATDVVPRPLPEQATQQLADLVARRRQIIEMIGSERQRENRANPRIKNSWALWSPRSTTRRGKPSMSAS